MSSSRRLSDLIHSIYAAAEAPERWPEFLEKLAREVGSGMTVLIAVGWQDTTTNIATSVRAHPESISLYQERWAPEDPWVASGHESLKREGAVVWSEDVIHDRDFARTSFYNDFARHFEMFHTLTATVLADSSMSAGVSCHYPRRARRPSRREVEVLEMLVPHVSQALRLHQRLSPERIAGIAATQTMERSALGFLVVDGRGRVLRQNPAATAMLARGDGIAVRDSRLVCLRAEDDARLRAGIAAAAETSLRDGTGTGAVVSAPRGPLRRPYTITISPISGDGLLFTRHGGAVAILVEDPELEPRPDTVALQRTYGWTPAETRVALGLVDGLKAADIARRHGTTLNTVRSQVRLLLQKTGVTSQVALVKVVLSTAVGRVMRCLMPVAFAGTMLGG